ncbi:MULTISPECIES: tetratricopeptide repeat protein [Flavobacteriaceae]|uniref:tetratricopeptide repeat protein n=1 Tax=Flavobacteriaceae TaxID=49546 RepID=UPI0014922D86|nr:MULTISPECIES: tetratricopeptide repeat protein [Allomuricauda]MDC6364459.1 tetratricopeptide repeat protein [Muricauda sp. AC10]
MKLSRSLIYVIFLCFFVLNLGFAQTQKIDSLKNLVETAHDTTKVNALRWLGTYTRSESKQMALDYGLKSLEKSIAIGYKKGEVMALNAVATTYGITGDYVNSLDYLKQGLAKAMSYKDYENLLTTYNVLGIVNKRIGDYKTSKDYYLKAVKLVDSLNLDHDVSFIYTNLGILYDLLNDEDKAIESYEKSRELYRGDNREAHEINILSNLALIDDKHQNYHAALDKLLKVSEYYEKEKDFAKLALQYNNIGFYYLKLKQWEIANQYLQQALDTAEQLSLKQEIHLIYYNLSDLKFQQKKYSEAIFFANKNLELSAVYNLGYSKKFDAHEKASEIYEAMGEYPKSIYHQKMAMAYKDSLLDATKVKEIEKLQIQYDVYSKDKEIKEGELQMALLNTQVSAKNKRLYYLATIVALLLFSMLLLFFRYRSKNKSNLQLQEKNELISNQKMAIEEMNQKLEKSMLRAQMNPHFIFNALNSIQHFVHSGDTKNSLKYLTKFSKLLRQVLESSVNIILPLNDEIELLKIYVELESLRFDNSFNYTFHIDENLDVYAYEVPTLLIQPYIENAILHGLMPKKGDKKLEISFLDKENYVECIVEDNGVGFLADAKTNKNNPSRGMSITAKRIEALRKFSNEQLISIENLNIGDASGTRVTILIPKDH